MTRIDEDAIIPWFKEAALLSYKECESESNDIMLYYDGEFKGMIEVWTDRSHESRMEAGTAEYILLNHTMYYISDIEMKDDLETMAEDMETVVGEKEVVLENGDVIIVPVNKFGMMPVGIHNAKKKELQELLAKLKKLEQAQGILRAAAISYHRKYASSLSISKGGECRDCGREMLEGGAILGQEIWYCVCWEDDEQ